jgi:eukaryotic-like serine/threonine-protein kinase
MKNNDPTAPEQRELSVTLAQIDSICHQFDAAWKSGRRPVLEQLLADVSGPEREPLLRRLLELEVGHRARAGESPCVEDYEGRFPDLGRVIVEVVGWKADDPLDRSAGEYSTIPDRNLRDSKVDFRRFRPDSLEESKPRDASSPGELSPGDRYLDFEILGVLGKGAFATVYYARELSLGRHVALKLSLNRGSEARTLASLDHDHIVKVFHESVDATRNLRVLCLQYISGTTLKDVIARLHREARPFRGKAILEAVDALNPFPAPLSPEDHEVRERQARTDVFESVCWLGVCLGRALAAAHHSGVLHRDIKPANILVNQRLRWSLTDFNLAISTRSTAEEGGIGGTLAYMAPEHLEAFVQADSESISAVDERSDVYSLAIVLFEAATGRRPDAGSEGIATGSISALAAARRRQIPRLRDIRPDLSEPLDRILRRAMSADRADRQPSAMALVAELEGARDFHQLEKSLPALGRIGPWLEKHPFWGFFIAVALANVACVLFDLAFQLADVYVIVASWPELRPWLWVAMTAPFAPTLGYLTWRLMRAARRHQQLGQFPPPNETEQQRFRRETLRLPAMAAVVSAVGWFLGGFITPAAAHAVFGDLHLLPKTIIGAAMSGVVAATYAWLAAALICLRVLYVRAISLSLRPQETAREEIAGLRRHLKLLQSIAVLVPLAGAMLVIATSSLDDSGSLARMKAITSAMILFGIAGLAISLRAVALLKQTIGALSGDRVAPMTPD